MSTTSAVLLALALLAGNAFFVGAEFALVSARRTQIEPRADLGSLPARWTLRAMEQVSLVMAAAQLGITVCSLGLGALAEPALAHLLRPGIAAVGLSEQWVHAVASAFALAIVVYLHVVLGEMVPKNLAIARPERAALIFGLPMIVVVMVLRPVVWFLNEFANLVLRIGRIEPRNEVRSSFTREQVEAMVDQSHAQGLLEEEEYVRLAGALGFNALTVADVLLPLDTVQTVPRGARSVDVETICAETGFSRFPVVDADPTDAADQGSAGSRLVGYLHIKDVLHPDPQGRARVVEDKWIRPFVTVRPADTLVAALQTLQRAGAHMARVVDDHGTTVGIATLEDVIEELVGEIRDAAHADGT